MDKAEDAFVWVELVLSHLFFYYRVVSERFFFNRGGGFFHREKRLKTGYKYFGGKACYIFPGC